MNTKIFIASHKAFSPFMDENYIPLHVGHAGKADLGYIGDDTGDNISCKNSSFCELTGLYWIWKNVDCDITGLCHYRRYLIHDGHIITSAEIEKLLNRCDIIIPTSSTPPECETVLQHYNKNHHPEDMLITGEVIKELCPEYFPAFEHVMNSGLVSFSNMIIARKDVFDKYCEWLFSILFEVEKRVDISSYDDYQKRIFGFISERLIRVWLMMQPYAVHELMWSMIE